MIYDNMIEKHIYLFNIIIIKYYFKKFITFENYPKKINVKY